MAKKTILQIVQTVGQRIGSDEIDSLDETIESLEIVGVLAGVYEEVISRKSWEFLRGHVRQLDAIDVLSTQFNTLLIPDDVTRVECLRYRDDNNSVETYTELTYLSAADFVTKVHARNSAATEVTTIINDDGVRLFVYNDRAPVYWTSFDETTITFDGYDVTRGNGNLASDSVIICDIVPAVDFTDPAAVLPVPQRMETLIINEAISTAAVSLRQTSDPKAEQVIRRQHAALRELEPTTRRDTKEKHYGRRTSSGR
jgi:hypothetical protein